MASLKKMLFGGSTTDTAKQAAKEKVLESNALVKLNLNDIISVDFPDNQYFKEQTDKKQIIIHHTVSGQGVDGDISWWRSTADRVGTAIIIGWDGKIYQCFSTKYWAHHIGLNASNNKELNMASIGVEIDAWGGLIRTNRLWYPAKWDENLKQYVANTAIKPIQNVQVYEQGYRGFYGFEKYTDAQIEATRQLLVFWGEKYKIPLTYNAMMFDVSQEALSGKSGIWSHTSFRSDKSDIHPQPELIQMLKSLK
jgi:N-acetyl-anhydromuramyl-L-alanine amidase AmpD